MASTILSLTESLRKATVGKSLFSSKVSLPRASSSFEQAAEVKLSTGEQAYVKNSEKAVRTISDASSYISVAQYATDEVSSLVDKARSIAESLATEVDQRRRDALASEGAAVVGRIDEIKADATFNDQQIIDGGGTTFDLNLDQAANNSDDRFLVRVSDVRISSADLGLNTLTEANFESIRSADNSVITTLKAAQEQLATSRASLDSSESKVNETAQLFGIEAEQRLDGAPSELDQKAEQLATQLKSSLAESLVSAQADSLDPLKVQELLNEDDEEQKRLEAAKKLKEEQDRGQSLEGLRLESD
jgi:hypothetical protein